MTQTLLIALAGALGAVTRYLLGSAITQRIGPPFPFATLLINVSGAFVIGLLFALTTHHVLSPLLQSILATGFLGGYTTFSTMSWEATQLAKGRRQALSLLYLVGSILLGLLAAISGILLGGVR